MKAEVVYLFAFDVAGEIATGQIQSILSEKPLPFEVRTDHTYPRDVPLYKPLAVEPTPEAWRLALSPIAIVGREAPEAMVTALAVVLPTVV